MHIVEQDLHAKYGPVIRTGPNWLSFSDQKAFESIYGFNHAFEKGSFYQFARDSATGASNVFSARTHAEHRDRRRKVVGAALTTSHIRSYKPVVEKHVQHFLSKLSAEITDAKHDVINVAESVHAFTFNALVELIYGPALANKAWTETRNGQNVLPAFRLISKFSFGLMHVPFLGWLCSTRPIWTYTHKPTFDAAGVPIGVGALVFRTVQMLFKDPSLVTEVEQPNIAKSILMVEKEDSRHMAPDELYRECFNLVFAGPGSTAAAVTGILERLGSEDGIQWQEKIRSDLKTVNVASESKILDAVVRESIRYSAPFPSAFPREVRPGAEMAIPGIKTPLPIGTIVSSNSWIVSHDKSVWGSDAEQWHPERWLDNADKKSLDDKFIAFSKGPRGCIGKDIAMMIITEAVAGLVSKWQIKTVGEMKLDAWLEMQIEWCGMKFSRI